jgi:site-specific recombinase XerD
MMDLIKTDGDTIIPLGQLPADLQEKIRKYAMLDIYKDKAKEEIKAKNMDIDYYIDLWIKTKKSKYTRLFYSREIAAFKDYMNSQGINPILCNAVSVDNYIIFLKEKYSNNSVRQKISICSSFYSTLKRYGIITINPFYNCPLPNKEYKKAIKTDQGKTSPVMNKDEYKEIEKELNRRVNLKGKSSRVTNSRKSARMLLPVIHFMAAYGLRIGAIQTVCLYKDFFTVTEKGNQSKRVELKEETKEVVKKYRVNKNFFAGVKKITIQVAVKRITGYLKDKGIIRHAYTCHDFRHFFATNLYRNTKDIVRVKNALGHSSLNVTDIYLQGIGIK